MGGNKKRSAERDWRADPEDGLRPLQKLRNSFKDGK